jgi:hypothetical protein
MLGVLLCGKCCTVTQAEFVFVQLSLVSVAVLLNGMVVRA